MLELLINEEIKDLKLFPSERERALKYIVTTFISVVALLPSLKLQHQLWYHEIVPLALMMTDIPCLLLFNWVYHLYPVNSPTESDA